VPLESVRVEAARSATWDATGWRDEAACRDADIDLFFPIGVTGEAERQIARAKLVCRECPVRERCLDFAIRTNQEYGVWGGADEDERRALRRIWRRGIRKAS
jgi:WhiB family redox-sensing transcriptional regulator